MIEITKLLNEKLVGFDCSQCNKIIFNFLDKPESFIANQCLNGCIFCKDCASKTKAIGVCLKCNSNAQVLSRCVSLELVFKNKKINCPNSLKETKAGFIKDKTGCQESILIGDLYNHMTKCEFKFIDCASGNEKCTSKFRKVQMEDHLLNKCLYALEKCPQCGIMVARNLKQSHLSRECLQKEVKCSKCSKMIVKNDVSNHMSNECPNVLIECRYKSGGCNSKFKRMELSSHLTLENNHIAFIDKIINDSNSKVQILETQIQQLNEMINVMKGNDNLNQVDENEQTRKRVRLPTNNNNNNTIQTTASPILETSQVNGQQQDNINQPPQQPRPAFGFYFVRNQ